MIFTSFFLVFSCIILVIIVSLWKVFEKAGLAGWKCLVPFYNVYCLVVIAGLPWWYFLLLLIPYVNFCVGIYIHYKIAQRFGKDFFFALGLSFLGFIFFPILAFGDAEYNFDFEKEENHQSAPSSASDSTGEKREEKQEGEKSEVQ